jgi:AraC-like DNA-binding protein
MTAARKNLTSNRTRKPASGPTVSAGYAKGLLDFVVTKGAGRAEMLRRAQIHESELTDLDNRIPFEKYKALMKAGQDLANDPALALHYGEAFELSELSIVGLVAYAANTIGSALTQLNRYGRLVVEVDGVGSGVDRFRLEARGTETWLVDTRTDANSFPELTESTFARVVSGTRRFGEPGTSFIKQVHVTHKRPAYSAEYDSVFGALTTFESHENAVSIDNSWATRKVRQTTSYAFGVLSEHAKALLESLEKSKTTRGQVESLLIPILHTGTPTIERTAEKMGLSHDTLYRKLKDEGVTYEKLLDELRHKMALHYLNGKKVSVNETAYLVGFSDASAFSRAFRRWTGTSPRKRKS